VIEIGYLVGVGGVVLYSLCVRSAYLLNIKIDKLNEKIKSNLNNNKEKKE
jgi:hypothetical protein